MVILNESKIKYDKLDELLEEQLSNITFSQQVNIIVDLKEVLRKFFRPDIIANDDIADAIEEISADIINIVGHYRNYFFKHNKYTNFYFLYSKNKCVAIQKIYPDYKKEYYEKYFDSKDDAEKVEALRRSVNAIEKVINRLPNCTFIETSDYDEFVYAKYLVHEFKSNELSIILSNDDVFFQLLNKSTFLLNLKGIKSELVTNKNAVNVLIKKEDETFSSNLVALLLAIGGDKKYSIKAVPQVALVKSEKIIKHLLDEKLILDSDSINVPIEFSKLNAKNKLESLLINNRETISKNYNIIRADDILYHNKLTITNKVNRKNIKATMPYLLELNAKVFTKHPLQLDMILKGEKV